MQTFAYILEIISVSIPLLMTFYIYLFLFIHAHTVEQQNLDYPNPMRDIQLVRINEGFGWLKLPPRYQEIVYMVGDDRGDDRAMCYSTSICHLYDVLQLKIQYR